MIDQQGAGCRGNRGHPGSANVTDPLRVAVTMRSVMVGHLLEPSTLMKAAATAVVADICERR